MSNDTLGEIRDHLATIAAAQTTVAASVEAQPGRVFFPIFAFAEADGTALADWVDDAGTTPGFDVTAGECAGIRWNTNAAPDPVAASGMLFEDLDGALDVTVKIWASKVGATLEDAVTFDVGAFFQRVGDLHDADADAGGTSDAMVGDAATKTIQECSVVLDADDVPAGPCLLTLTLQPTDGTLGTDDVIVHAVYLEFTRLPVED